MPEIQGYQPFNQTNNRFEQQSLLGEQQAFNMQQDIPNMQLQNPGHPPTNIEVPRYKQNINQLKQAGFINYCKNNNINPDSLVKVAFSISDDVKRNLLSSGIGATVGGLIGFLPRHDLYDTALGGVLGGATGLGAGLYYNNKSQKNNDYQKKLIADNNTLITNLNRQLQRSESYADQAASYFLSNKINPRTGVMEEGLQSILDPFGVFNEKDMAKNPHFFYEQKNTLRHGLENLAEQYLRGRLKDLNKGS